MGAMLTRSSLHDPDTKSDPDHGSLGIVGPSCHEHPLLKQTNRARAETHVTPGAPFVIQFVLITIQVITIHLSIVREHGSLAPLNSPDCIGNNLCQ